MSHSFCVCSFVLYKCSLLGMGFLPSSATIYMYLSYTCTCMQCTIHVFSRIIIHVHVQQYNSPLPTGTNSRVHTEGKEWGEGEKERENINSFPTARRYLKTDYNVYMYVHVHVYTCTNVHVHACICTWKGQRARRVAEWTFNSQRWSQEYPELYQLWGLCSEYCHTPSQKWNTVHPYTWKITKHTSKK